MFRFMLQAYRFGIKHKLIKKREYIDSVISKTFYGTPVVGSTIGNDLCRTFLESDQPCMLARIGTIEMGAVMAYMDKKEGLLKQIGEQRIYKLCNNAGFFPKQESAAEKFAQLYIDCAKELDLFGVFGEHNEDLFLKRYAPQAKLTQISYLGPYYFDEPWSKALKGKKILVVHPFENTIKIQYSNRANLFDNPDVLPEFAELNIIKAIQTVADNTEGFSNWFDALEHMKKKIAEVDFDIAIIGCGAYGFPLAAYVKSLGKKSVLTAGSTQLLFGIKGARWDNTPLTSKYYRDSWVRPSQDEVPKQANKVESGCYW